MYTSVEFESKPSRRWCCPDPCRHVSANKFLYVYRYCFNVAICIMLSSLCWCGCIDALLSLLTLAWTYCCCCVIVALATCALLLLCRGGIGHSHLLIVLTWACCHQRHSHHVTVAYAMHVTSVTSLS